MLALLDAVGLKADAYAGHSFGEVTALHAAGVISSDDFLHVARRRGELMAAAVQTDGTMLAVSESIGRVHDVLAALQTDDVIANHNAPDQIVLSGRTVAIDEAAAALKERGVASQRLNVVTAFHSPVVAGASEACAR